MLAGLLAGAAGCRSPFVQATVTNDGDAPVRLVEVDYPGGSFGTQTIAPHNSFHYRFKILGSDAVSVTFTDATGKPRSATGPHLAPGQQGQLQIEIGPTGNVQWKPSLTSKP